MTGLEPTTFWSCNHFGLHGSLSINDHRFYVPYLTLRFEVRINVFTVCSLRYFIPITISEAQISKIQEKYTQLHATVIALKNPPLRGYRYTAKVLFHRSPTRHSDSTVCGQRQCSHHAAGSWQQWLNCHCPVTVYLLCRLGRLHNHLWW